MSETINDYNGPDEEMPDDTDEKPISCQAGYLPVPLKSVPVESLGDLDIYLEKGGEFLLYSSVETRFGKKDVDRLLDSDMEFVYVSVKDHQRYYRTMEHAIENIVADPGLQKEKKSEILYATSMELSNQLLAAPPGKEEIDRASRMSRATVNLIMKEQGAFNGLFDVFNHDFYTATHLVNVCTLAISAAQKMGLVNPHELQRVGTGGLLHDIGKIFISSDILNKPERLTAGEFKEIRKHAQLGIEHLEKLPNISEEIKAIVGQHHERLDGSGYPRGLKHDELSPLGMLAGIVDTFDAMTSVRPYREKSFTVAEALQTIEDLAPDQFDAEMVHAFNTMVERALKKKQKHDSADGKKELTEQIASDSAHGLESQHIQYYFRIPVVVKRIRRKNDKLTMAPPEQVVAHKLSCIGVGWLSDRPFDLNENIILLGKKLQEIQLDKLPAVVTCCRYKGGGWYTVDAQFHKAQSPEAIEKIKLVTSAREMSPLASG